MYSTMTKRKKAICSSIRGGSMKGDHIIFVFMIWEILRKVELSLYVK